MQQVVHFRLAHIKHRGVQANRLTRQRFIVINLNFTGDHNIIRKELLLNRFPGHCRFLGLLHFRLGLGHPGLVGEHGLCRKLCRLLRRLLGLQGDIRCFRLLLHGLYRGSRRLFLRRLPVCFQLRLRRQLRQLLRLKDDLLHFPGDRLGCPSALHRDRLRHRQHQISLVHHQVLGPCRDQLDRQTVDHHHDRQYHCQKAIYSPVHRFRSFHTRPPLRSFTGAASGGLHCA